MTQDQEMTTISLVIDQAMLEYSLQQKVEYLKEADLDHARLGR